MDENAMNKEDGNQNSPPLLKLKAIELENKLLLEKQRYILLQSELESSMSIASKHIDLYKNECMSLKEKLIAFENENNLLKEKELKNQETIRNLLKKTERFDKECCQETQKECGNLNKNDNEVKEENVRDDVIKNEGENKQVFVDLDIDSDYGMKHSPEVESDDSLILISECKTPKKKFKSSTDSICSSTMDTPCDKDMYIMSHTRPFHFTGSPATGEAGASGSHADPRRTRVSLFPKSGGGFELQPSDLILSISKRSYMSRITACWPAWDEIPSHVNTTIWNDLLAQVDIDEKTDLQLVRNYWNKKMRKNYRDTLSGIKHKNKKPDWMSGNVYAAFLEHWQKPAVIEVAQRNSANRNKNPVTHRGGSKSFQQYRKELEHERGGPVSYLEVFTRTHAIEHTNEDGSTSYTWSDTKSKAIMAKFETEKARVLEGTGRDELTPQEEDMIFDAVTDKPTRNRRYGYGNQKARSSYGSYKKAQ